jgi:hypothetical protein
MLSCNWIKGFKRIALTLALALTLAGTITFPTPPPDRPDRPTQPVTPHVNWGS